MKKEDLQNSQQGTGSAENRGINLDEQKNQTTHISGGQQNDVFRQAGLGRDRMTDLESLDGTIGREDFAGDDEDLTNENLNAANDQ